MNNNLLSVSLTRDGVIRRRSLLQLAGAGFAGMAATDWLGAIGVNAAEIKAQGKACIMCFLEGAPSQMETWDPKPGTENGGETKAIKTAVPGIEIAEFFPKIAQQMKDIAVVRTLAGKEAAHERGRYHLRTGRRLTGSSNHPHIGAVTAHEIGDPDSDIPNFVSIGGTISSGFLGVDYAPFTVTRAGQLPSNVKALPRVPADRMRRRLEMLRAQDESLAAAAPKIVTEHLGLYDKAADLMTSDRLKAFTFAGESDQTKKSYGNHAFGQGCLVARRLVESGVPFVEVKTGGWDMHQDLWKNMPRRGGEADQGVAALLTDLRRRGLLDSTLVVVLGEFGRTPRINNRTPTVGRDHWARNFGCLLAGGGIRGGQVIGATSDDGMEIADRPVEIDDLFQTLCASLGIDAEKELWTPDDRPLRIVDAGEPIGELIG